MYIESTLFYEWRAYQCVYSIPMRFTTYPNVVLNSTACRSLQTLFIRVLC